MFNDSIFTEKNVTATWISNPLQAEKLNKMKTVGKSIKSPEEIKICEPLGRWVEHILESIIQLYSKLVDMDFIHNLEVVEKDVESSYIEL